MAARSLNGSFTAKRKASPTRPLPPLRPPLSLPARPRPKHSPTRTCPAPSKKSIALPPLSAPGPPCGFGCLPTVAMPLADFSWWSRPPAAPHQPSASRNSQNGIRRHSIHTPQPVLKFQASVGIEKWANGSEWMVESILNFRRAKAGLELLMRWQGYDLTYNSWECDADVLDRALVRLFLSPPPRPSTLTTRDPHHVRPSRPPTHSCTGEMPLGPMNTMAPVKVGERLQDLRKPSRGAFADGDPAARGCARVRAQWDSSE